MKIGKNFKIVIDLDNITLKDDLLAILQDEVDAIKWDKAISIKDFKHDSQIKQNNKLIGRVWTEEKAYTVDY